MTPVGFAVILGIAKRLGEAIMEAQELNLPAGNFELKKAAYDCRVESVDAKRGLAKLVLSVGPPHKESLARHEATNLAIYVTLESALKMSGVLDQLGRTMATLQQQGNAAPNGTQTSVGQPRSGTKPKK
jgi:hypothetical protein